MNTPMFSIVVPCYNVESYLDCCLESVVKQSYTDFEVLLINDGSTDETLGVCEKWEKADQRIRVISKPNEGLSMTRNFGIKEARGKYVVFLDGDDFIEEKSLEWFFSVIQEDTDVIITRLIEDFGDETNIKDEGIQAYFENDHSKETAIKWVMSKTQNSWPSVKYIASKKYLQEHELKFKAGYLHEDMDWTTNLFAFVKTIAVSYEPWYHHRMKRKGSITNVMSAKRITDVIEMAYNLIDSENAIVRQYPEECRGVVIDRIMKSVFETLVKYRELNTREEKKTVVKCAQKYKTIFRYQPKRKFKVFMAFVNILGFQLALDLYSLTDL